MTATNQMLGVLAHDSDHMTTDDAIVGFGVGDATWTSLRVAVGVGG